MQRASKKQDQAEQEGQERQGARRPHDENVEAVALNRDRIGDADVPEDAALRPATSRERHLVTRGALVVGANDQALLDELRLVRDVLTRVEQRLLGESASVTDLREKRRPLTDDSIVDQRSVPAPKDLYLRLARAAAFPSKKIGKRIVARWGDVRAAFLEGPALRKTSGRPDSGPAEEDELDNLREQLGLAKHR